MGGRKPQRRAGHAERVLVAADPDLTIDRLHRRFADEGVIAHCVFDGAISGAPSRPWIEQALAPTLTPGDVVVTDNLAAHKVAGAREAVDAKGADLAYPPADSPDLNPSAVSRRPIRPLKEPRAASARQASRSSPS